MPNSVQRTHRRANSGDYFSKERKGQGERLLVGNKYAGPTPGSILLFHIFLSCRNPATADHCRLSPRPEGIPPEETTRQMDARGGQLTAPVRL